MKTPMFCLTCGADFTVGDGPVRVVTPAPGWCSKSCQDKHPFGSKVSNADPSSLFRLVVGVLTDNS